MSADPKKAVSKEAEPIAEPIPYDHARRYDLSENATKKVFKHLIPFLLLMYVIAFLDRSNVGFAKTEFEVDFGISAGAYAFGAGLFFIGYAVFEVPSNIMMHKVGAKWWMARIMISWGLVAAAFFFVTGPVSFYILRFLLGVAEAGFFPGVILYLTYWVPARHLNRARGMFYMGLALAGIIGNPISGALLQMDGIWGWRGIQWMFLIEGIVATLVGFWSYHYLTDKPLDAHKWLEPEERQALHDTIESESVSKAEGEAPHKISAALVDWRVWYFCLIYFGIQIAVYGMTFFLPTQVASITGQSLGFASSLVTAIPWIFGLISVLYFPGLADRTRKQHLIGTLLLVVAGIGLGCSGIFAAHPVMAIAGLSFAAIGFVGMQAIFWSLPTEYLTGVAAATGIGLVNSIGNLGGFVAPNLRTWAEGMWGDSAGVITLGIASIVAGVLFGVTKFFKKANDIEAGHIEGIDPSLSPSTDDVKRAI